MNSTFPVNLLGSRQNLKSAEAAGEGYPERSSLPIKAIGTAVAALLGSHFPNTNYFALLAPPLSGGKVRTRLIRSHAAGVSSPGTRLD